MWSDTMCGRTFAITWGPDDSEEVLRAAYLTERDGPIRSGLHALWLLRPGRSLEETTSAVGVHYRTVQR